MAEFLRAYQSIAAPIIEWGGLLLLLFVILSPFLIIRHRVFRPTRWWHIVGAYATSSAFFLLVIYLSFFETPLDELENRIPLTDKLRDSYEGAYVRVPLMMVVMYPLTLFYSIKLLYGSFTKTRFGVTFFLALALFLMLAFTFVSLITIGFGYAMYTAFN